MKKIVNVVLCIILIWCNMIPVQAASQEKSAQQVVNEISFGWSLGNTLDSCNSKADNKKGISKEDYYETLWWNPKTTKKMIDTVRASGCNTLRIPVTYLNHIDSQGRIDRAWLDRIGTIVQYGLQNNMYVVINVHHETGNGKGKMIQANLKNIKQYQDIAYTLWSQIADYFKNYDNKLMFEGFNETLDMSAQNPWYGNDSSWKAMNMLNQTFVDTVRKSGGSNGTRNLIVNTYGAQTTYGPLSSFTLPNDTVSNHLIVGVHYYGVKGNEIKGSMNETCKYLVNKGYPVIVGEFGTNRYTDMKTRVDSASTYVAYAKSLGIKCFWWDDGGDYRLLNRNNCSWYYPDLIKALSNAA